MNKKILLLSAFFLTVAGCGKGKKENINTLIFSDEKSIKNLAELYKFKDGSKLLSEYANIEINIDENEISSLSDALEQNKITIDDIILKMIHKDTANDGGSKIYTFNAYDNDLSNIDFILVKCNTFNGNKNILIGTTNNLIENCKR